MITYAEYPSYLPLVGTLVAPWQLTRTSLNSEREPVKEKQTRDELFRDCRKQGIFNAYEALQEQLEPRRSDQVEKKSVKSFGTFLSSPVHRLSRTNSRA